MVGEHAVTDIRYAALPNVASCQLGDGAALLNLQSGLYFSMNAVASVVWDNLQDAKSVGELAAAVHGAFDVSQAQAEADVATLLEELLKLDLIEKSDGSGS